MKRLFLLLCGILLLADTVLAAGGFSARVDRHQLHPGESLLLTLELDRPDYFVDPDISPLQQDFELLSSRHIPLTGKPGQQVSRWQLRLQPRREGDLQIPALRLGELMSAPIRIRVDSQPPAMDSGMEPVHIDAQIDREELYVRAQALLTLKIYHSIPLYADGTLSPLDMADTRVESLGEPAVYEQYIHGIRHGVIEMRYAIFPQSTGTLVIPALTFTATLAGDDQSSLDAPRLAAPGQSIEVRTAQIPLQVKPPPAGFPEGAAWLPATRLQLEQTWLPDAGPLAWQQPLERTLTLDVRGLPASYLQSVLPAVLPDFEVYDNPLQHTQLTRSYGLRSKLRHQQLLVARQPGEFGFSALEVPWWNTDTDSLEYARLEPVRFRIDPAPEASAMNGLPDIGNSGSGLFWPLLSLLLGMSTLLFAYLWRRARRLPAVVAALPARSLSRALEDIRKACLASQPEQARNALDSWTRLNGYSLAMLSREHPLLHAALDSLNQALYAPGDHPWDGVLLWQAVSELVSARQQQNSQTLPPLYPP